MELNIDTIKTLRAGHHGDPKVTVATRTNRAVNPVGALRDLDGRGQDAAPGSLRRARPAPVQAGLPPFTVARAFFISVITNGRHSTPTSAPPTALLPIAAP